MTTEATTLALSKATTYREFFNALSQEKRDQLTNEGLIGEAGSIVELMTADAIDKLRFLNAAERTLLKRFGAADGSDDSSVDGNLRQRKRARKTIAAIDEGMVSDIYDVLPLHPANWTTAENLSMRIRGWIGGNTPGYLSSELLFLEGLLRLNFELYKTSTAGKLLAKRLLKLRLNILFPHQGNDTFDTVFERELTKTKGEDFDVSEYYRIANLIIGERKKPGPAQATNSNFQPRAKNGDKGVDPASKKVLLADKEFRELLKKKGIRI